MIWTEDNATFYDPKYEISEFPRSTKMSLIKQKKVLLKNTFNIDIGGFFKSNKTGATSIHGCKIKDESYGYHGYDNKYLKRIHGN